MEFQTTLNDEDLGVLHELLVKDEARVRRIRFAHLLRRAALILAIVVVAILAFGEGDARQTTVQVVGAFILVTGVYLAASHFIGAQATTRRINRVIEDIRRDQPGPRDYVLDPDALRYSDAGGGRVAVKWSDVAHVVDAEDRLVVFARNRLPCLIPRRAFASPTQADEFVRRARQYMEQGAET